MITRDSLHLQCTRCYDFRGTGVMRYRDNVNKISAETVTPLGEFRTGKPVTTYWIDGVEKEFTDVDDMIDFYNEKFIHDSENPDVEVNFVKVYKKRNNKNGK